MNLYWNYNISTYVVPLVILIAFYILKGKIKFNFQEWILLLFKADIVIMLYAFILYFLDKSKVFDSGWAVFSILFFAIPAIIVLTSLLIYFKIKNNLNQNS